MSLKGKAGLVTEASRGIGSVTAVALTAAGARVLVHYARSAQETDAIIGLRGNNGDRAETLSADLSAPSGPETSSANAWTFSY